MICHVWNMFCLSQGSLVKIRKIFPILVLFAIELIQQSESCKNENCSPFLRHTRKLTKLTNKKTAELLEIYKASQGDSSDLMCDMQMDNVPEWTVTGQTRAERISCVYMLLKEFLPHLKTVMEQQKDLDPPANPVTESLGRVIIHVHHIVLRLNCLLQTLQPNIPIPEPADRPTGIPPAQNIFQQKAYGCIILSRLQQLLSQAVIEQKSLKGKVCRRTNKLFKNGL
ncbi:hypothetical protein DNTS_022089 [Danionella cerebrum]|uniref:Ciliary neurotrophic factor n=1 Tax=Danionella cerebrum TaxID=2873325 RepID=A0A553Q0Z4_9TELE|nr:hypothetical protein DNTS_022089 [Danionella translucida]